MCRKYIPYRMILIACLWLAFLLRVWGLDFGLPYEFHPDERQYVNLALNWHTTGHIEVGFVNPPLYVYILVVAYWPWFALSPFTPSDEWITTAYTFARLWSVAFGMLTVALAYSLGKRLYNRKAGLLAVVFLGGLFLPARESHFAVNDTAVTFFALLAIYFSVALLQSRQGLALPLTPSQPPPLQRGLRGVKSPSKLNLERLNSHLWEKSLLSLYLAAGVAAGLTAASKLTGGIVVVVLLVAHTLSLANIPSLSYKLWLKQKEHWYLGLSLLVALTAYLLVSVHIFWQFSHFIENITEHLQFGARGYKGLQMAPSIGWGFYTYVFGWGMGWVMLLAALAAVSIVLWRRHHQGVVVAAFPVVLFAYMGGQKILFARFLLPAIPPLAVLVAVTLARLESRWLPLQRHPALLWPLIVSVLLAQPLTNLIWFDHLLTLPDTRQIATEWVTKEFPKDTVITKESYSILPTTYFIDNHWPYKVIHIDERGPTRNDIDHYVGHKTELIALSNFTFDRVRADPAAEKARLAQLAFLEEKATLVKIFSPYRQPDYKGWFYLDQLYGPAAETWQRVQPGPLIKLYHLPYQNQPYSLDIPDLARLVNANFAEKLILLGYDLPTRRAEPGGGFPLTLYWQASSRMHKTYVIFNHLLDTQQQNWGGYDRWPQETANTILWRPGEVVIDTFNLPVAANAPNGIYTIDIGLYDQADPAASPLPIMRDGAPIDQNSIRIGPVKVGGPPPNVILSPEQVNPHHPLSIKLGHPPVILLHGYNLTDKNNQPINNYQLTLYWESIAQTPVDWSIFVHVRNQAGETVAQKDGPAGGGQTFYPTSLWDVGEIIADEVTISLPSGLPPGQYRLVFGLYNLADGLRLPVPDSVDNEIVLTTWERP